MIIPYPIFKSFCLRLILYILYHSFRTSYLPKSAGSFFWLLGSGQSHYYWGVPSSRPPQWTEPENTYLHIYIKFSQISVCVCVCITIPNMLLLFIDNVKLCNFKSLNNDSGKILKEAFYRSCEYSILT